MATIARFYLNKLNRRFIDFSRRLWQAHRCLILRSILIIALSCVAELVLFKMSEHPESVFYHSLGYLHAAPIIFLNYANQCAFATFKDFYGARFFQIPIESRTSAGTCLNTIILTMIIFLIFLHAKSAFKHAMTAWKTSSRMKAIFLLSVTLWMMFYSFLYTHLFEPSYRFRSGQESLNQGELLTAALKTIESPPLDDTQEELMYISAFGDARAIEPLITALKWQRNDYCVDVLKQITGHNAGLDYESWNSWWISMGRRLPRFPLHITNKARAGNAPAQIRLGLLYRRGYLNGYQGEKDPAEAAKWFLKAAEQGDSRASFYLGDMHYQGELGKRDIEKSIQYFKHSAERRNLQAMRKLAYLYQSSNFQGRDQLQSYTWILLASYFGDLKLTQDRLKQEAHGLTPDQIKEAQTKALQIKQTIEEKNSGNEPNQTL
jgi:hypothetical protein